MGYQMSQSIGHDVALSKIETTQENGRYATLAIVAVMRGEARYILEWVAYYRALGADPIVIYDNGENGTILRILSEQAAITIVDWPSSDGTSPQFSAYNHAMDSLRGAVDFVGLFDADEFLALRPPTDIREWLGSLAESVSAIAVNQRIFGSSGYASYEPGLVIQRFQNACEPGHDECHWIKSIYRPRSVQVIASPHRGTLHSGQYILPNGVDAFCCDQPHVKSRMIDFSVMQPNHYIIKSREEFRLKQKRGDVNRTGRLVERDYFDFRETYANRIHDDLIVPHIPIVTAEIERMVTRDSRLEAYYTAPRPL